MNDHSDTISDDHEEAMEEQDMLPSETSEISESSEPLELSEVVIALLKGVIYSDDARLWGALIRFQARVRDYVSLMQLELMLDEVEGYAVLRTRRPREDEDESQIPRVMARRKLSFPVSLLLALLRKKLAEFDARGGDTRLVLSRSELVELIRVFLPDGSNDVRLVKKVDTYINKVVELGFLRLLKSTGDTESSFEVRRILKTYVDAQWLRSFDMKLDEYRQVASREK